MRNGHKSVLFFTPFAGRTGSEMFLWYMFSHSKLKNVDISLISDCDGELLTDMPSEVTTFVSVKYPTPLIRLIRVAYRFFGGDYYDRHILRVSRKVKADFWYLNTVLMTDKIRLAKRAGIPVIMHFHELTTDYSLVSKDQLKLAIDYSAVCVADSMAVYEKLKILGAKKLVLQYECIDISKITVDQTEVTRIKNQLNLETFDFIWLMSGTSSTRKGIDMVPELAKILQEQNAALVWIGNNTETGMDLMIREQVKNQGSQNVFFLGKKTSDYYNYMCVMDGFVLTSREEPFGMVVVEALALGKPVVAFNAGGVSEIVTPETGIIVDSWNVKDLADAMLKVSANISEYSPEKAKERALYFDVSRQVQNWEQILKSVL